jgi:hypothetical protein
MEAGVSRKKQEAPCKAKCKAVKHKMNKEEQGAGHQGSRMLGSLSPAQPLAALRCPAAGAAGPPRASRRPPR